MISGSSELSFFLIPLSPQRHALPTWI
ncbi:protein of unknown function [Cupriavidus taiwanensis]|uniref:Uncharacterized protein n=1 Tax=Cupriavidus taiwanensis TaxID=164546 RepID=A0A375IC16_9BURK|nr:hypothetical protein CBM2608_A110087 [Cupriavidus taiwanensis]SPA25586.1 hypothetical protein CBM2623_A120108 [Cupriavidus taiwanensis]SPK72326.1 protein of unknown function [Cupriavidus taiwanensis]